MAGHSNFNCRQMMVGAREHKDVAIGEVLQMLTPVAYEEVNTVGYSFCLALLVVVGGDKHWGPIWLCWTQDLLEV